MRRYEVGTPCPAPPSHRSFQEDRYASRRSSVYAPTSYADGDTTANIEYTTEIQPSLLNVKPKRPMRASRRAAFHSGLDIFEDVAHEEEQAQHVSAVDVRRRNVPKEGSLRAAMVPDGRVEKRNTMLGRGAQKIHLPAAPVPVAPDVEEARPQRRRVSKIMKERHPVEQNATVQLREDVLDKRDAKNQGPKKEPRRRTIYVPSDDTTFITIHPGHSMQAQKARNPRENSPNIGLDLVTLSEEEPENLVSVMKKEKKAPRKSLAAPPKRVPLVQTGRQGPSFGQDVRGQGGGKENVPPGMEVFEGKNGTTHIEFNFGKDEDRKPAVKPAKVHFNTKGSDVSSKATTKKEGTQKRLRSQLACDGSPAKSLKTKADALASSMRTTAPKPSIKSIKSRISKAPRALLASSSPFHTDRSPPTALRRQKKEPTITLMHEVGRRPQQRAKEKYPVLAEDLARPEMYEDNWLTYQEVAITQLLNSMFDTASKDPNAEQSSGELRRTMLDIYHEPSMPALHKRLQASLQYGALSIPKDLLTQTLRLKDDVGLRKKFLNLWVKSYDLTSLRAAAETVIGRQITVASRLSSGSTSSDDGSRLMRAERRAIENFLEIFLIRNEDAVRVKSGGGSIASLARGEHSGDDFGSQGWLWRRTALRSLMLLYLLDKAKAADALSGCLFRSSSPYKTSTDVLHALSNMLLPSHGDITRPLGHLNYKVDHVQYPLQEYTYHINNIAIDLRDGVILTRLVELLLYLPSTLVERQEDTVAITMPSGDILTSSFDFSAKESWVLSQHLKFPSIGRAQKLYNVQVAIAALRDVRGLPVHVVGGIKAEDIVDGHREQTLSLLWSLVGKHGLGSLVDWPQLVKEVERFREQWYKTRNEYEQGALDSDEEEATFELDGLDYHKRLLLSWARCIARTHGHRITNLTTSFSNPKVLEAIVDTYLPSTILSNSTGASSGLSLAAKLKATGCSTSFVSLFASASGSINRPIPSRDFTLLTLSFLASRLLPLCRTHRAASTIQRAYRLHLFRRSVSTHIAKMKVAHECAAVALKREKLVNAAMVVQKRWRAILENRRATLEKDVIAFQSAARAWAIRRWARRVTGGRVGGKEKVRRRWGGW
jgi:abnormal spindle-like microcephaly-associated protein